MSRLLLLIEELSLFVERKDHLIRKLTGLSASEKERVIDFFRKKPNLENKIDWNKKNLTFSDFEDVMDVTKTERKKKVKRLGISGLRANKDYIQLRTPEGVMNAYIPLDWEASKLLASSAVGGCEGKWCTAYQKEKGYWIKYVYYKDLVPIYFIGNKEKFALMVDGGKLHSLWDKNDKRLGKSALKELGFEDIKDFNSFIAKNRALLSKARDEYEEDLALSWIDLGLKKGTIKIKDADYDVDDNLDVTWNSGTWLSGAWDGGVWKGGTWEGGVWRGGDWWDGVWKGGEWIDGQWSDGVWHGGFWHDGFWENGTWLGGTFGGGTWLGGNWKGGKFNGFWRSKEPHPGED